MHRLKPWSLIIVLMALTLSVALTPETARAQYEQDAIGVGAMVGEPTGLTLKKWTSSRTGFDLGLAWSLGRYDAFNIHADYLWHNFDLFEEVDTGRLPAYYGIGGSLVLDDADSNTLLGVRVPLGVEYLFETSSLGAFAEVAPVLTLIPDTDVDVNGVVGIRVYL